jgi:transposase
MEPREPSFEELVALVKELRGRVAELERCKTQFLQDNARLLHDNEQLRRELDEFKRNKPPSGPPSLIKPPPSRGKRKKPGRPQGHLPALRPPPEIHQEIEVPLPAGESGSCLCPHCSGELTDIKAQERVVEDIVPAKVVVTRYHTSSGFCKHCKKRMESRHPQQPPPADLPHAQLGLNALATAAVLKHDAGLPYRKVCRVLNDLCRLNVSPGALPKQMRRMSTWLAEPYQQIKSALQESPVVHADETGAPVDGKNQWLWTLTSPLHTLFHVDPSRGGKVVLELLGEKFDGHLVSDFFSAYNTLPYKQQKCNIHLLREIKQTGERNPDFAKSPFARRLKRLVKQMLALKKRWNELDDATYTRRACRLHDRLDQLGKTVWDDHDVNRLARRVSRHANAICAFLYEKDLPGENNAAERAIRPAVIIRKISGGHRGATTAKASAVITSVLRTARQQGRHLIDTVKQLIQSHLAGQPADLLTSTSG